MKKLKLFLLLALVAPQLMAQQENHIVKSLKITILSTMMAQQPGIGEWGFSALVEADSVKILFDTGARERTVLENSKEMNVEDKDRRKDSLLYLQTDGKITEHNYTCLKRGEYIVGSVGVTFDLAKGFTAGPLTN